MTPPDRVVELEPEKIPVEDRMDPTAGFMPRLRGVFFSRRLEIGLLAVFPAALLVKPDDLFGVYWKLGIAGSLSLILAGIVLRTWAGGCAGTHTGDAEIQAPRLATGGPYAFVRNPIYLGTILIGLGMVGIIGDSRLLPLCLLTFLGLYAMIIPTEEKFLRESFREEYHAYFSAVPRLIPRVARWNGSRAVPFNWGILAGEARIAAVLAVVYGVMKLAAYLK